MEHKINRIDLARKSLIGVSVGDCFGQTFFEDEEVANKRILQREIKKNPWHFTDDTIMSISIYKCLEKYGYINQKYLAKLFGENYLKDWHRGYGGTAHQILRELGNGENWRDISPMVFDGMGSMGNGAAMRSSLVGAYFYDDINKVIQESKLSAEITHYNNEGIAGSVAISISASLMIDFKEKNVEISPEDFILKVYENTPESDTKYKIKSGVNIKKSSSIDFVTSVLGNGVKLTSQDTVPFVIWCVANYGNDFEEAMWKAVSALGDRDTICAMVGGIVILKDDKIPDEWNEYIENIEDSIFF